MFNVVLIGMPGAGKTVVGQALSERLAAAFVDTDHMIESRIGMSVPEVLAEFGEAEFRKIEKEVIMGLRDTTNAVIATGGGAVVDPENFEVLFSVGKVVALSASVKTLQKRLKGSSIPRPLLSENDAEMSPALLQDLFDKRQATYAKADVVVKTDGKSVDEIVETILANLKS